MTGFIFPLHEGEGQGEGGISPSQFGCSARIKKGGNAASATLHSHFNPSVNSNSGWTNLWVPDTTAVYEKDSPSIARLLPISLIRISSRWPCAGTATGER